MSCCCGWTLCLLAVCAWIVYCLVRMVLDRITIGGLHARPVLITGCDSGFGFQLALKCLNNGVHVFAACLTQEGVDRLRDRALDLPGTLDAFTMNVTDQESVDAAVEYVESKCGGGLWGLVNNAGVLGYQAPDEWLKVEDYEKVLAVNTLGVIRGTHAFRHLIRKRQGRIVTVASIAGRIALPTTGPYSVSKYAVEAYCDVLRAEMYIFNVTVSILEPGFFKTELLDTAKAEAESDKVWERVPDDIKELYGHHFHKESNRIRSEAMVEWADPDIFKVVDAYYHALFSRFPRDRYQVGWDSVFFFIPFSMIWTPLQDKLLIQLFRHRNAPVPRGAVLRPF